MRHARLPAWIAVAILLSLGADGPASTGQDPWQGKSREEIVSLLGEPTKAKAGRDKETLTYKLFRLDHTSALVPGMLVVDLPGVGLVGRHEPAPLPRDDKMEYEPTQFDEEGRPIPGGFRESQDASISWDTDTGKVERDADLDRPENSPRGGKLTVKFELGKDGRVAGWSVSPKKRARQD